ncbi:MAG: hypothetical protein HY306_13245 [Nitrosomonadales bacterium]|nr:hypothetical protein [Nitrosomonadales bacterium]
MAKSLVLSGLMAKHSEILGQLEHHALEINRLDAILKNVDATIKLFDPTIDLRKLEPRRYAAGHRIFRRGEVSRLILGVLREAGCALNTLEIALQIADKKKLPDSDLKAARETVLDALHRLEKKGAVHRTGRDGNAFRWVLN